MEKTRKRILLFSLILILGVTFNACKKSDEEVPESEQETEEIVIETLAPYEEKTKVAVIVSDQNGSTFEELLAAGALRIEEELGEIYELTIMETGDDLTKFQEYLYQAADDKMNIIISFGKFNRENFEVIPTEYPSTYFILFDEEIDYSLADLSNVLTVIFDTSQASYLAGATAALHNLSETALHPKGKIGFYGTAGEEGWKDYLGGFWQGVKSVDEDLTIHINEEPAVTEDETPLSAAEQIHRQLLQNFNSVYSLREEYGEEVPLLEVMIKGETEPEEDGATGSEDEPEAEAVLEPLVAGMMIKRPDNILYKLLRDNHLAEEGLPYGRTMRYGLAYDGVELQFDGDYLNQLAVSDRQTLEAILAGLQKGEIILKTFAELTEEEQMAVFGVK